jgi:hypothetical protein
MTVVDENARVAKEELATILWFDDHSETLRAVRKSNEQLGAYANTLLEEIKIDATMRLGNKSSPTFRAVADKRLPIRLTRGPLDFGLPESKLPKDGAATGVPRYQLNGDVRFEIPNFIDGKKNISDIERALMGEFGSAAIEGFDRFIEDLVKVGVVKWK